jgi:hypothetical protein
MCSLTLLRNPTCPSIRVLTTSISSTAATMKQTSNSMRALETVSTQHVGDEAHRAYCTTGCSRAAISHDAVPLVNVYTDAHEHTDTMLALAAKTTLIRYSSLIHSRTSGNANTHRQLPALTANTYSTIVPHSEDTVYIYVYTHSIQYVYIHMHTLYV